MRGRRQILPYRRSMQSVRSTFHVGPLFTGSLALIAMLLGMMVGAAPAQAAYVITFTPAGGSVGTAIPLTASVSSGSVGVGVGTVSYFASGTKVADAAIDGAGTVSAISWTPLAAGSIPMYASYASADGTQVATSAVTNAAIVKATTTTTLSMPANAKTGVTVTLKATVAAGSYLPTGSVTFTLPNGTVLASSTLGAQGEATLNVQMPQSATTYQARATYNGDANANGSTSETESSMVSVTGSVIDLTVSAGPYAVGVPITLTATLSPISLTGSVTFSSGSTVVGAQAIANGKATLQWTPPTIGAVRLAVAYIPTGSNTVEGTDAEDLEVMSSLQTNRITLGPSGQTAWLDGQGIALRYQGTIVLSASSLSGATVGLSISGPCSINGSTITGNAGSGTCTLTATSAQSTAYSAGRQVNTIALARGKQTATLIAPTSSTLLRRSAYRLALPGTRTNVGNLVGWSIVKAPRRCKVSFSADGAAMLRTYAKGVCKVRVSAPPVAGQWLKFQRTFRYRVR